jgi:Flp pilus assembly protein TadD
MLQRIQFIRASSAAFVLALVVAGCGTDEEKVSDRATTSTSEIQTTPVVDTAAPAPETQVAVTPQAPTGDVTYEQSETAFLEGRYDEAVDLFTKYTERRPSNPWGHYMLGMSAWKSGRADTAEHAFQQAVALDSTLVKGYLNLARVLIEASRPSEAIATIDRAIAVDGESSVAFRLKGNAYQSLGQKEDAIASYRHAIEIDPEDAWSMNNLAFILIDEGRYDEALPALARATELRKDVPVFFNNLGMALERTGHFRAAEEAYTFASSLGGVDSKSVANRDRVVGVVEQPGLEPVDLAALAHTFASEFPAAPSVATTNTAEDDLTTNPADTTTSAQSPR